MKAGLLKAAMYCMEERTPDWWSTTVTTDSQFKVARDWVHEDAPTVAEWEAEKFASPKDAANFLLLVRAAL